MVYTVGTPIIEGKTEHNERRQNLHCACGNQLCFGCLEYDTVSNMNRVKCTSCGTFTDLKRVSDYGKFREVQKMLPLDLFKMGYVILYRNNGNLFGNAITKRQLAAGFGREEAEYTHVEISGGEEYSINISPPISKLVKITEAHKGRYVKVMCLKNDEFENGKRYKVAYFSAALCANKPYDILGVLSFLSFLGKWIKQDNRLYFCSEGALTAFQKVFPNLMEMKPEKCMPAHFFNPVFEEVWEGVIL